MQDVAADGVGQKLAQRPPGSVDRAWLACCPAFEDLSLRPTQPTRHESHSLRAVVFEHLHRVDVAPFYPWLANSHGRPLLESQASRYGSS